MTAAIDQVLRNTSAELSVVFYVNGVATDADGDVMVVVTSANGLEIANETALDAFAGDGRYEWRLDPQANLARYSLAWTGAFGGVAQTITTEVEVVGGFLFTIAESRAFRDGALADESKYLQDDILDARSEIAEQFERYCQVSFVPRYRREVIDGNGRGFLYLDRREVKRIISVTEDGISLSVGTDVILTAYSGRLSRVDGVWSTADPQNIIVEYEHGYDFTPAPIKRSALIMLRSLLVGSDLMDRKVSQTDESGTFRLSYPDFTRDRPTGIPYVDARLNEYIDLWGVA